jgi:hypothetical protein
VPLEKGSSRETVRRNIEEMEASGHPRRQAVAAALRTAHPEGGGDMEPREMLSAKSHRKAAEAEKSFARDEGGYQPVTAMTHADINKKNEQYWGNIGPASSPEAAPELAGTRVAPVKVYGGTEDEVSPTQSDPGDRRSDNLLSTGAEEMSDSCDSTLAQRAARKESNKNKISQQLGPTTRGMLAEGIKGKGGMSLHGKEGRKEIKKEGLHTRKVSELAHIELD